MASSSDIPPSNPVLSVVEGWQERTPLVTRYLITLHGITYASSWVIDSSLALSAIPHFVLTKYEIYRLILSPLVNTSIFSLLFAVMSFGELGKRLEYGMGSAAFGWMSLLIALATNLAFLLLCFIISFLDATWMLASTSGMWLIYYGILAVACSQAPSEIQIRLCFINVRILYFPLALHLLFSLIGGGEQFVGNCLSLLLGYAVGNGLISAATLTLTRATQWEGAVLSSLGRRPGWVSAHAATGIGSGWSGSQSGNMMMPLFGSPNATEEASANSTTTAPTNSRNFLMMGDLSDNIEPSSTCATLSAIGRTLGGTSRRGPVDPRAARLQALEKRQELNEP